MSCCIVRMDKDSNYSAIGIDTMKVKIFNGVVGTLTSFKHLPKLRRILISFRALDTLDYGFSAKNYIININIGTFDSYERQKSKNFIHLDWEDDFR